MTIAICAEVVNLFSGKVILSTELGTVEEFSDTTEYDIMQILNEYCLLFKKPLNYILIARKLLSVDFNTRIHIEDELRTFNFWIERKNG